MLQEGDADGTVVQLSEEQLHEQRQQLGEDFELVPVDASADEGEQSALVDEEVTAEDLNKSAESEEEEGPESESDDAETAAMATTREEAAGGTDDLFYTRYYPDLTDDTTFDSIKAATDQLLPPARRQLPKRSNVISPSFGTVDLLPPLSPIA